MAKLRWGILSTAKIGVEKVIPAMQQGEFCEVVAIASRNESAATEVAQKLGIPGTHGSYEALLQDPEVDAVYNPLPNHLHVPWSIRALEAGKHVLCEKPIGLSVAEAKELAAAAEQHSHLKTMEAFMYRHHPQWLKAHQIVHSGGIGTLRTINTVFSYFNDDPENIRNRPEIGGGALMDIGCYPISLSRFIFGSEPVRVTGFVEKDPNMGVDRLTTGVLEFASGTSTFTCSTQLCPYQRVNIYGTHGRVEIEIPFNAPPDRPCRMWHEKDGVCEEILLEICDQYTIQGDLFAQAVLEDKPVPTPLGDAIANMEVIEKIASGS